MKGKLILKRIIERGGLVARCARMYVHDDILTRQFIIELSEQCHLDEFKGYFGKELVNDINNFVLNSS